MSRKPKWTGQQRPFKKLHVYFLSILTLAALQGIISEAGICYCFVHPGGRLCLLYLLVPLAISHHELLSCGWEQQEPVVPLFPGISTPLLLVPSSWVHRQCCHRLLQLWPPRRSSAACSAFCHPVQCLR